MRNTVALPLLLIVFAAFILPTTTTTASLIGYTYDQIQYESDFIILGRVTDSASHSGEGSIAYQLRKVTVEHYFKGNGPPIIEVKEFGGDLGGGISVWVEDQPELSVGASYVLFLSHRDGFNYVTGGPQGALRVEGNVARNFSFVLRITNSGLAPVPTEKVTPTGFANRTRQVTMDPTRLVIYYNAEGTVPGYWTFNIKFIGISGESAGITKERHLSDFVLSREQGVFSFDQNFTSPGVYRFVVDGVNLGELEVEPPSLQVPLVGVAISGNHTVGEAISLNVTSGKALVSGELRTIVVVSPRREGADSFYQSYANCWAGYPQFFGFNMVFREAGNYTLSFWQNGVKQLTREITISPEPATGDSQKSPEDGDWGGEVEITGTSPLARHFGDLSLEYVLPWLVGAMLAIWLLIFILSRR